MLPFRTLTTEGLSRSIPSARNTILSIELSRYERISEWWRSALDASRRWINWDLIIIAVSHESDGYHVSSGWIHLYLPRSLPFPAPPIRSLSLLHRGSIRHANSFVNQGSAVSSLLRVSFRSSVIVCVVVVYSDRSFLREVPLRKQWKQKFRVGEPSEFSVFNRFSLQDTLRVDDRIRRATDVFAKLSIEQATESYFRQLNFNLEPPWS